MGLFQKEDRVQIPGTGAEGVVLDVVESIEGFPVYTLRWLSPAGETLTGTCGEGDLRLVNPNEADDMHDHQENFKHEAAVEAELDHRVKLELNAIAERRRRRAARKSKRKR